MSQKNKDAFKEKNQDSARQALVQSIAANIYESLRQNGDINQVFNSVLKKDSKMEAVKNLAESIKNSLVLRGGAKDPKKEDRGDSGLYSEGSQNNCEFIYASNIHVENKHFQGTNQSFEDTYEEFTSSLPLPVAELNTNSKKRQSCESTHLSEIEDQHQASQAFDQLYENMKRNGEIQDIEEEKFGSSLIGLDRDKKPIRDMQEKGQKCDLPPLEDPSFILTSPDFPRKKLEASLSPKLNESIEQDPELAREVITSKLRNVVSEQKTHDLVNKSASHFEELKVKQKEQLGKFHEKLMQELELEQFRSSSTSKKEGKNQAKKFITADCIQDSPVSTVTYDPLHQSPIPKKRHESESQTAPTTPVMARRASLEPPAAISSSSNFNARFSSLPRRYNSMKQLNSESYMNKSDFWSGSLPRQARRKVQFELDKPNLDNPPARPPPPTPLRQASLKVFNYQKPSIYDHDNEDQYKVDLGLAHKDPWVELYGKAVLDNSLQDRIEARKVKSLYSSPVQQSVQAHDQERLHEHQLVRDIVLKVLRSQGIPNPSNEVIDNAIMEHLSPKVFVGSASEGLLMPGDRVVSINHQDASKLTHLEAQNLMKYSGTSAKIDVARPGIHSNYGFYPHQENYELQERDFEVAKVHSQPYRTKPLVSPTAKPLPKTQMGKDRTCPLTVKTQFSPNAPKCPMLKTQEAAQVVSDALSLKQPFRTMPLVTPAPKTMNDFTKNRQQGRPEMVHQQPLSPTFGQQPVKTVNIGGVQKQIVSGQFNSPLNLYSDEAIAESALTNQQLLRSNTPTLSQIQNQHHPGYVPSAKPHLPTPKDATFSRPQVSETFKIILESEMDKARDHHGMVSHEFPKEKQTSRPNSVMSNKSTQDPFMIQNNINQSTSFKRLMYSVLGEGDL